MGLPATGQVNAPRTAGFSLFGDTAPNSAALFAKAGAQPSAGDPEAANDLYADGVRHIEAGDAAGVVALRKAAEMGDASAQFYMARLYETGEAGVKKDPAKARHWTERAALTGDPKAMHNLGLYYFEGVGGPKDDAMGAQWFHRAADRGLVDSQYNLARLYEDGVGVSRNLAEAYKWYLIAAGGGDPQAKLSALRIKDRLSPDAQATAANVAKGFQSWGAHATEQSAVALNGDQSLATAQKALSRLGYYQGPSDGIASPALTLAIAAYQRDQQRPATGSLDASLNQSLALAAR